MDAAYSPAEDEMQDHDFKDDIEIKTENLEEFDCSISICSNDKSLIKQQAGICDEQAAVAQKNARDEIRDHDFKEDIEIKTENLEEFDCSISICSNDKSLIKQQAGICDEQAAVAQNNARAEIHGKSDDIEVKIENLEDFDCSACCDDNLQIQERAGVCDKQAAVLQETASAEDEIQDHDFEDDIEIKIENLEEFDCSICSDDKSLIKQQAGLCDEQSAVAQKDARDNFDKIHVSTKEKRKRKRNVLDPSRADSNKSETHREVNEICELNSSIKTADAGKKVYKKHFCFYCGILLINMNRHLQRQHATEKEMQEALVFPKGSASRNSKISDIRKMGDRKFNMSRRGENITVGSSPKPETTQFVPCPLCQGYYSKKNLKNHVRRKCSKTHEVQGNISGRSKLMEISVNPLACAELTTNVYPTIHSDEILSLVTTDDLVVRYGNMLVKKYYKTSNSKIIAQRLRHLGRLFFTVKELDPSLTEVVQMLDVRQYDNFIKAVHKLAGREENGYKFPSVASFSTTLMANLVTVAKCQAIKEKNEILEKKIEKFAYSLKYSKNSDVNKPVTKTRARRQRLKQVSS